MKKKKNTLRPIRVREWNSNERILHWLLLYYYICVELSSLFSYETWKINKVSMKSKRDAHYEHCAT